MAFMNKIGNILRQTSCQLPSLESSTSGASIYRTIRCFSSKLFVGGLSYATDENSLREAFTPYGNVIEARIIVDRESGRSRGFGFVSYSSSEEASAAIQALDGRDLHGRSIKVAHSADQRGTSRGPRFSGSAGYGPVGNHSGGFYNNEGSNYGHDGGHDNPGSSGGRNTGGSDGSNYESSNIGNAGPGGSNQYDWGSGASVGSSGDFGRQDFSNMTSGNYGYSGAGIATEGGEHSGVGGGYSDGSAGSYGGFKRASG